jgi:hypothetical protein
MAVVPTPKATQPRQPEWGVCESLPTTTWPGSAYRSCTMMWQMVSLPVRSASSPCSRTPLRRANSRCRSWRACAASSRPAFLRSSVITWSRKARWSRKNLMLSGSLRPASGPTKSSQKLDAIGVTYSWLNRRSVRTKPVSPAFTAGTPMSSSLRSTTQCRARIFSATVIGRSGFVSIAGTCTSPLRRATA